MRNGLVAGSVAAIVAALVSLPLHSPVDNVFNTVTVVISALLVGVAAGLLWDRSVANSRRLSVYIGGLAVGFLAVVVVALVGNIWLERMASFTIPLDVIAFAVPGLLVPNLPRLSLSARNWPTPALLIIAAVVGIGLVGQGDAQSGDLSLPDKVEAVADAAEPSSENLRYVVGEGSEITFTVGEQLSRLPLPNDAVMRTTSLSGVLNLDGRPSEVAVDLLTLTSDQDFRDRYTRRAMFRDHPTAVFTVPELADLPPEFFSGGTYSQRVTGVLSINGIDVPMAFDLEVRNDGNVLNVLGSATFTWEQFQIPVPTARSVVSVDDEVSVQLLLVATSP